MSGELIAAIAVVLGAAVGAGGVTIGELMSGRSQRRLAQEQRTDAQHERQRVACESFLACLDIYLMVADEAVWAKRGAKKAGNDPKEALGQIVDHYWSAWNAFLSANATLQLATRKDVSDVAAEVTTHAYDIDAWIWNLRHGGTRVANEYTVSKTKINAMRNTLIDATRKLTRPPNPPE
ncbi:hypothetical protein [Micromonospora globbae]|uniref:hypothetical protein n=1 Tax=Micromonospora globbae TaxID=1894969 RepID=UPI0011C4375E|nr:hypothetical protein [Micromonospora globbae]